MKVPDHWREAAEKTGDKSLLDIIKRIDERNAVLDADAYRPTPPTGTQATTGPAGATPPGVTDRIGAALGMKPSGPFRSDYKSETAPVTPEAAQSGIAQASPDRPVVDPTTGKEIPAPPVTPREELQTDIARHNEDIRKNPIPKTPNLEYVKPEDRDVTERPVPPSIANDLFGVNRSDIYFPRHLREQYPTIDPGSQKWVEEFRKRSENAKDATHETLDSNMELNKLIKFAQEAKQIGGVDLKIGTPWGNLDIGKITPGGVTRMKEGMKDWFSKETKVSEDQFKGVQDEATKWAAKRLAGTNLSDEDKGTMAVMLEAAFYRSAVAFARANNNGGKQISDQDMKIGLKMAGDITLTGPQNIALTKANTERALNTAANEFGQFLGRSSMPVNFDSMTSQQRQRYMNQHTELKEASPLSPGMFKQLVQAEADYQRNRKGEGPTDPNRFIQRTGDTEEDYRAAQQKSLRTESGRKESAEERAKSTEQRAVESHQIQLDRFKLEQQRYMDALAQRQQALAQAQQDKMAAAFARIGQMIAGSVRGGGGMGGGGIGGGEQDAGAFRITPAPQRGAPRVAPAPALTRYGGPIKKQ
jgi:hypothetical protein